MATPTKTEQVVKAEDPSKMSAAATKKYAKAQKQARRAAQKEEQPESGLDVAIAGRPGTNGVGSAAKEDSGTAQQAKLKADKPPKGQQQQKQARQGPQDGEEHHKRTGSQQQSLPIRRRPSQSGGPKPVLKKDNKQVELFSHLYTQPRRHTVEGASKDVHPAVLALGLQMSSYEICGSSARCVAMLLAFKEAIQAYITPSGNSLARHMVSHYLSPQIDFLKTCRPISESMGNAIRWLKNIISKFDPDTDEQDAKDDLCEKIDTFIRERITVTDQAIAASASRQIKNGSVLLTYAKSSIVEKTILEAHSAGTKFRIIIVDSRPLFEGKYLATSLTNAGLEVEYVPFSAISHAVKQANLVLLGAHSMLGNGRLMSRIGTAPVAMQAAKADIPVIVCCESVKFSGKVALDSIVLNEVAPSEELLLPQRERPCMPKEADDDEGQIKVKTLMEYKDIANLQILNLMYDITPAEHIRMIICEYGSLPPSSVPVVHRLANEGDAQG